MSKFHFSVLAILFTVLVGLCVIENIYKKSLPLINLPIQSHNTIGEIPLISQIDSGGVQNITPRLGWGGGLISMDTVVYKMISSSTISYIGDKRQWGYIRQ